MKVAVTGGSGVVGKALVRLLVDRGHEVIALARSDLAAMQLHKLGAIPTAGDVTDPDSLGAFVEGSDVVFNVAGVNELCTRDPARMWRVNVDGALSVLSACQQRGVPRLVQTSSVVAIGAPGTSVADEGTLHRGHFLSEYERSKTVAERLLFEGAGDTEVVSVNPSSVQGPGRSTGTGRLLLAAASGKARVAIDATISLVDIDDCALGHLAAAERGVPGQRYVLSGATTSVRRLIRSIGEITGRRHRPYFLSKTTLRRLGPLVAMASPFGLCEESLNVLLEGHRYDGSKATNELGVTYTSLDATLRRTIEWFEAEGLMSPTSTFGRQV